MAENKTTKSVTMKDVWADLSKIDVKSFVEEKASGRKNPDKTPIMLKYLNWARTFAEISGYDPDWSKKIVEFDENGIEVADGQRGYPYQKLFGGYFVVTEVTIKGNTRRMWLPVMDAANKPMKDHPYNYNTKYDGPKTVAPMDTNALNNTIMRCFVKNISTNFGLGWKIYAGEELDTDEEVVEVNDSSIVADPVTGEVVEGVESYDVPIEDVAVADVLPEAESPMKYEEALTYCLINGGPSLQGTPVLKLVTHSVDPEKSMKILNNFAQKGKGKDKEACQLIIDALGDGRLKFPDAEQVKKIKEAAAE